MTQPAQTRIAQIGTASAVIPRFAEYGFFGLIIYSILAGAWGVLVPFVGAAALGLLTIFCVWRLRFAAKAVYAPLAFPVGCAIISILVQAVVHGYSLTDPANRELLNWIFKLIIIQSLLLRERFIHRFALATLATSFLLIPYLNLSYGGGQSVRAGLEEGVGFANPNDLAAWFGFCSVYCIVVAIETKRNSLRILWASFAVGCLVLVGLTVSRATLMAVAIAGIIAARRLLKRGFLPVLLIGIIGAACFFAGVFDQSVGHYEERGTEESGRLLVWPLVIDRFLDSPVFGVGMDDLDTYVPEMNKMISPHNGFLYIGLASGVVALLFFVMYWFKALSGAFYLSRRGIQDAPFQLPLVLYTFVVGLFVSGIFLFPWAVVTLANAMPQKIRRRIGVIVRSDETTPVSDERADRYFHPHTLPRDA